MPKSVILDTFPPRITGRLHHALPLSIIPENDERFDPFFYSNYIQMTCKSHQDEAFELNFYEAYFWNHKYPHLKVTSLDRESIRFLHADTASLIKNVINAGYYFHVYLNEFYLPLEFEGMKIIRDALVHGYDEAEGAFFVLGFQKDHQLHSTKIPYQDFLKGFEAVDRSIDWANDVFLYTRRTDIDYRFDPVCVMELLGDYVHSRDTSKRYRSITNPQAYRFGMDAVRSYYATMENNPDPAYISVPCMHTFWEHKKIMAQRLHYMQSKAGFVHTEKLNALAEQYKEVVEIANSLRLIALKFNLTHDKDQYNRYIGKFQRVIQVEEILLPEVLSIVEQSSRLWQEQP